MRRVELPETCFYCKATVPINGGTLRFLTKDSVYAICDPCSGSRKQRRAELVALTSGGLAVVASLIAAGKFDDPSLDRVGGHARHIAQSALAAIDFEREEAHDEGSQEEVEPAFDFEAGHGVDEQAGGVASGQGKEERPDGR